MTHGRRTELAFALVIAGLAIAAYSNSLNGDFVYDDVAFIQENPLIRDLSNVPAMFSSAFWESSSQPMKAFYRPLTVVSYAANYLVGGNDAFGYHVLNVAIHAANAILVFLLILGLTDHRLIAAVVALLFALHPVTTEVVAWVSGRGDLLGTFFYLGAAALYVRAYPPDHSVRSIPSRTRVLCAASVFAFFLGLFSKESVATLVGVLILYELCLRGGARNKVLRLLPFLLVLAAYLGCRVAVLGGLQTVRVSFLIQPLVDAPLVERLFTGILIFGKYVALLIFPLHLAVDYSYNQIPIPRMPWTPEVLVAGSVGVAMLVAWWASWKRDRVMFFGLGWFFVTGGLIFANALFPFTSIFGERYMYLPLVGFVLAAVRVVKGGIGYVGHIARPGAPAALAVIVLSLFFVRTWTRNNDWRDEFSLFQSAVETCPDSALAHYSLANQHYRRGQYEPARAAYDRALAIYPDYGEARAGLGNVALAEGDYGQAFEHLSVAATLRPEHGETSVLLGVALAGLGRLDDALRETERALRLNPKNSQTYNNLANIQLLKGNRLEAMSLWKKAIMVDPLNAEALYNLAYNHDKLGQIGEARAYYERFIAAAPERLREAKARAEARLAVLQNR